MNQQQPDNFFRDKLHNYQRPVPQGAWHKIESALEKKTERKFVWWKVAAVFFLVAGAAYLLWFNKTTSNEQHLAIKETQSVKPQEKVESPKSPDIIKQKPEISSETPVSAKVETDKPKTIRPTETKMVTPVQVKKESQESSIEIENATKVTAENPVAHESDAATVSPTVEPSKAVGEDSNLTLTFSSEETNRYLNKNTLAEATSAEKKPSSLKKFLQKANDLKSNQDPFGDLRERKNEILALNFKNDKRGQNK